MHIIIQDRLELVLSMDISDIYPIINNNKFKITIKLKIMKWKNCKKMHGDKEISSWS